MHAPIAVIAGEVTIVGSGEEDTIPLRGGIGAEGFEVVAVHRDGWLWAGYLKDARGIWWFHGRTAKAAFVSADADGFRVLDNDYGLDRTTVYLEDRPIPGADPASFEIMGNGTYFAKDRHRIYVKGGKRFFCTDQVDAATAVANGAYVADKDHLFHHFSALGYANAGKDTALVELAAPAEHGMLLKDWLLLHHSDIDGWWHPDYPSGATRHHLAHDWYGSESAVYYRDADADNLVRGADPGSFEVLDADHARDRSRVFCRWREIAGAHPSTFETLGPLVGRDADRVYYNGYAVAGADVATFTPTRTRWHFGTDARHVYRKEFARTSRPFGHPDDIMTPVPGSDPAGFEVFGELGAWARDARQVYLWGEPKKKLDPDSFDFLGETPTNSWARDAGGLYRSNGTLKVAGIDGSRFRALNEFWGSDNASVFSFVTGAVARAADAASFAVTDDQGGAEDCGARYRIVNGGVRRVKK